MFSFYSVVECRERELALFGSLNPDTSSQLIDKYNSGQWCGSFGCMAAINHSFLVEINDKYNLENLIDYVGCRKNRMCLERVIGLIFHYENTPNNSICPSIFGDIFNYANEYSNSRAFRYSYQHYVTDKLSGIIHEAPLIKVWAGR